MTVKELEAFLIENNIPTDIYSLDGGVPNETYCIEKIASGWHVYYSERGKKNIIGKFDNEDAAVRCFLGAIPKAYRQ